ncbi:hypothetical protein P1P91_01265 [Halomonas piscis]|uniref:S-adenosylmethionine synthetase N-terminal domain-containing protein n=1 Tax=Halomonas piscis TaxID=3031727 RepID=A0ABY9Z0W4_9GAMM|nr:hypothetical protein [Halomonas piscis]WNK20345.1 hypothetical protein P1P91_01265 [Halomonas piscis]
MSDDSRQEAPSDELVMFTSDDGRVHINCHFEHDTLFTSESVSEGHPDKMAATGGHGRAISERCAHHQRAFGQYLH